MLAADDQHVAINDLDLHLPRSNHVHVDDKDVGVGQLLDVRWDGGHGLGVPDVGPGRGIEGLLYFLRDVHQMHSTWVVDGVAIDEEEVRGKMRYIGQWKTRIFINGKRNPLREGDTK